MTDERNGMRTWATLAATTVIAATLGAVVPSCEELDASRTAYRTAYGGDYGWPDDDDGYDPCGDCAECGQGCDENGNCTGEPCGGAPCVSCTADGCVSDCDDCEFCSVIPGIGASCAAICEGACSEGVCACESDDDCNPPNGSTCQACVDGECVSACDADNCETCDGPLGGANSCQSACPGKCDGHGECHWGCDETCDSSQCEGCVGGECQNVCDDGMVCIDGDCHAPGCEGDPPPCSVCQDGEWVTYCEPDSCSTCRDGACENACEEWETCLDGECIVEADCDPPCNAWCESCVIQEGEPTCEYACSSAQECIWDGPNEADPGPGGKTKPKGCYTPCEGDCGECGHCSNGACVACETCIQNDDGSKSCQG